jgi:hypothetical protein
MFCWASWTKAVAAARCDRRVGEEQEDGQSHNLAAVRRVYSTIVVLNYKSNLNINKQIVGLKRNTAASAAAAN